MKKRLFAIAVLVVFAVAVFAGCAGSQTQPSASASASVAASPSASASVEASASASASASVAASASASASASAALPTSKFIDAVKAKGKLTIGCEAQYPPFEYHKLANGKDDIVGSDIDLANIIAKDLGVTLEIKDLPFDTLITALNTKKIDMIISAMEPKDERKKNADFSDAYYGAGSSVIIRKEDAATFTSIDSLKGKKVGAQLGSTQESILKSQMKDSSPLAQQKEPDMILALKSKKIDGIVVDTLVAENYVKANPELVLSTIKLENVTAGYAIALNKGYPEFVTYLNSIIKGLNDSGDMQKMIDKANADSAAK